eukprot:scaffold4052_cov213-Amphora_coffeaeformis.AAC.14
MIVSRRGVEGHIHGIGSIGLQNDRLLQRLDNGHGFTGKGCDGSDIGGSGNGHPIDRNDHLFLIGRIGFSHASYQDGQFRRVGER